METQTLTRRRAAAGVVLDVMKAVTTVVRGIAVGVSCRRRARRGSPRSPRAARASAAPSARTSTITARNRLALLDEAVGRAGSHAQPARHDTTAAPAALRLQHRGREPPRRGGSSPPNAAPRHARRGRAPPGAVACHRARIVALRLPGTIRRTEHVRARRPRPTPRPRSAGEVRVGVVPASPTTSGASAYGGGAAPPPPRARARRARRVDGACSSKSDEQPSMSVCIAGRSACRPA